VTGKTLVAKGFVHKDVCVQWHRFVSRFEVPRIYWKTQNFTRKIPAVFEPLINLFVRKLWKEHQIVCSCCDLSLIGSNIRILGHKRLMHRLQYIYQISKQTIGQIVV